MIFNLFNRHDRAASTYREIAADIQDDEKLKNWFSSLAEYRQGLADQLRPLVEDNGSVPVKPSRQMKHYLDGRDEDIIRFINERNEVGLIELSLEAEKDLNKYYQEIAANKHIPSAIREKINAQHERLLEVIQKAQRMHTVPE